MHEVYDLPKTHKVNELYEVYDLHEVRELNKLYNVNYVYEVQDPRCLIMGYVTWSRNNNICITEVYEHDIILGEMHEVDNLPETHEVNELYEVYDRHKVREVNKLY